MKSRFPLGLLTFAVCLFGCDPVDDGGDDENGDTTGTDTGTTETGTDTSTETGDGLITNACGTFDPMGPGDSAIPQDPDDPVILEACTTLCATQAGIEGCTTEPAACLEHCKLRSCAICPGTLAPLVDCENAMFTGEGCTCDAEGIDCPVPAGCSDLEDQTGFCGG